MAKTKTADLDKHSNKQKKSQAKISEQSEQTAQSKQNDLTEKNSKQKKSNQQVSKQKAQKQKASTQGSTAPEKSLEIPEDFDIFSSWLVETPIAHRGFHSKTAPENSLAAFSDAIERGFAIELDVHLLADGCVAVFHDASLARMTGNDGYLKYLTQSDLKSLKLDGTKETIPTLAEVLALVDGKVPLLIEIKNEHKVGTLEQAVIDLLKNYNGEYAVQSFNPYSLAYFKKHAPYILRGQLSGSFKGERFKNSGQSKIVRHVLRTMKLNKKVSEPHFISYEDSALPCHYVKKFKNLPLLAWPVGSKKDYMRVVKHCDNVIFENFIPEI